MNPTNPINNLLTENQHRLHSLHPKFNPISGQNSIGQREKLLIPDFPIPTQHIPTEMATLQLIQKLKQATTLKNFIQHHLHLPPTPQNIQTTTEQIIRLRSQYDFPFWAATFIRVLSKKPGQGEIPFILNNPQRKLVTQLEQQRKQNKPIRLILLKTRQWGGSTCIQLYMAWLQLIHKKGLNSVIVAQKKKTSFAIKTMFDRALLHYPVKLLHPLGAPYNPKEKTMTNIGLSGDYKKIPQRDSSITIASYESPDAIRGDAYALAHLSEVALWETTEKKTAQKIVRSTCQGILPQPYTMIIYESTANGTGNFFHNEYLAAKDHQSQFTPLFIPWFDVEWNTINFKNQTEEIAFAQKLLAQKDNPTPPSDRQESGTYLWQLWQKGATLQGINWYITERAKYSNHDDFASECPSDDIEAFTYSGRRVFPTQDIEQLRPACSSPTMIGDIYATADTGEAAFENIRFKKENGGQLHIWADVEKDDSNEIVTDRYIVAVDVCKGHTKNADFACIAVLDRLPTINGQGPEIVAEWHGHIDMDKLAWKAAQIAEYYNHALLVIESNTLETNRSTRGDAEYILTLIRDCYDNLYARRQSAEDIREGKPKKYGFHTNISTKPVIIQNLKTILRDNLYVEREAKCLDEYSTYMEDDRGAYAAMEGHHDDRLMTRAIGLWVSYYDMKQPYIISKGTSRNHANEVVSTATLI